MSDTSAVTLAGRATAEEIAAVLAVLTARTAAPSPDVDHYRRWRRSRLGALRGGDRPRP